METDGSALLDIQFDFPQPLSFRWRVVHNILYLIGGITFFIGSAMYFPTVSEYEWGGWLFTIGSASFLCADTAEWWMNNRVGCFMYSKYRRSYEKDVSRYFAGESTLRGKWQRAENGLNFFMSMIGSLLYFIGSILYIPEVNGFVPGTIVYIIGSAFIYCSQSWKLYRSGCTYDNLVRRFSASNWKQDVPGFFVDLFAGLGGVGYFVGSILFLPEYDISDAATWAAATWFLAGGAMYWASGMCMVYRYFFTLHYPH